MLVITTNSDQQQAIKMPYLPFTAGTTVCNVFDASGNDCLTVTDEGMDVTIQTLPKIYLPKDHDFFEPKLEIATV